MNSSGLAVVHQRSWGSELDSRNKIGSSRSEIPACAGEAVPQEAETARYDSVAIVAAGLERIRGVVQVGICPAVKDVEEIRTQFEPHALLDRNNLAKAQLL